MTTKEGGEFLRVMNGMQEFCHGMATSKGFWNDTREVLALAGPDTGLHKAVLGMIIGQRIALMVSELGEQLEGARKDNVSDKLEGFTAEEEELADLFIRGWDYAGFRKLRLGEAILAKLEFNANRPHKHGKNF